MNKIINSILYRLSPLIFKIRDLKTRKNFQECFIIPTYKTKELLFENKKILSSIIYKDEHWSHIKNLSSHMWNDLYKCKHLQLKEKKETNENKHILKKAYTEKNKIKCKSDGQNNDWIFLHFDKIISSPYIIEFEAKIEYATSEFQIAFNYQSIGKRYRFNLINNKKLCFEVINNGFFHTHIIETPFSLELNKYHHFKVIISDKKFAYIVNKKTILCVEQKNKLIKNGSFVFILWNTSKGKIKTTYKNINIHKLLT